MSVQPLHAIHALAALESYRAGRTRLARRTWEPEPAVLGELEARFYAAVPRVAPTGQRTLVAIDVSGSMEIGQVAGVPGLTPRLVTAAMALVAAATEKQHGFVAFTRAPLGYGGRFGGGTPGLTPLAIDREARLEGVVQQLARMPFGGVDCALPMRWALEQRLEVDVFVIYTDVETWVGEVSPAQALAEYRERTGLTAKLVVVGMLSRRFAVADPTDPGMLDIVGFDLTTPTRLAEFVTA
jgi:60 kDa SS-A/Ro ribonucleoprotein